MPSDLIFVSPRHCLSKVLQVFWTVFITSVPARFSLEVLHLRFLRSYQEDGRQG